MLPPNTADSVLEVEDNIAGKINALNVAQGIKPRTLFKNVGNLRLDNNAKGIKRGRYVTTVIPKINKTSLSKLLTFFRK